jgi:hypothetical protein
MRRALLVLGIIFVVASSASGEERKVPFRKGLKAGVKLMSITTYKGVRPQTKTCEGGCPTPLYRWPCNDNESCGINCAAHPPYGYCY